MPAKNRKIEHFDPNKSDSADTDFDPTESRPAPRKKKLSRGGSKGGSKKTKKTRYRGSDISDEDVSDDELDDLEASSSSEEEEEDFEMSEKTGRRVRQAAKAAPTYEEPSDSDIIESESSDSEEVKAPRGKTQQNKKRSRATFEDLEDDDEIEEADAAGSPARENKRTKIIRLKVDGSTLNRVTGSAIRSTRSRGSAEPTSAGVPTRRATRATSEAIGEAPIALSNSGRHTVQEGQDPVPIPRSTRGGKGLKKPSSTIKEEIHESTEHEEMEQDEDNVLAVEVPGTDEREAADDVDVHDAADNEAQAQAELEVEVEEGSAQPVAVDLEAEEEDDDDDFPITRRRGSRSAVIISDLPPDGEEDATAVQSAGGTRRLTRGSKHKQQKRPTDASSDFEPVDESAEELSASDAEANKKKDDEYDSGSQRRGRRAALAKSKSTSRRRSPESEAEELDQDELAEELFELKKGGRKRRPRASSPIVYEKSTTRIRKPVDYSIKPMEVLYAQDEEYEEAAPTPSRRVKGGRGGASQPWERTLYTTFGPFGGGGGLAPAIGGMWGNGVIGAVDSDSSDDENNMVRPTGVGGNIGMTPTSAMPPGLLPGLGQTNPTDPTGALGGTPANLGKVGSRKALADADPLGVDQDVDFSKIGGLDGHIDQLKEMVQMPLLYPELFMKFHVTPPRGVLFHGPPGTGKTLLARALAATVGSGGRKITFYMRKGADALSKWVGEAERQLRLLFEEARKTQPSIIFFDEIDGLAPVRSSKQEQIHASIVSTLLALMDGMDGRGQVIVIGATNRPDNIDPALRRPGRFDREFYFALPDMEARKSIININTRDWGIDDSFKTNLAQITKGYGGADLRALCTEAALNAIQRTFPQIYSCNDKLIVDPDKIKVTAKDFMLSVKKMIPSSERATSSGAAPLPQRVEPLLRDELKRIEDVLDGLIPIKKKTTALQEAMYEQYDDEDQGFGRETMQQEFEKSRVFRPRLLICGETGMGQAYLGGAVLNHFEGLHVQSFDLPTIFSDSTRNPETAIVQLFAEVKRHKPSVIYLPGVEIWWQTLTQAQKDLFLGMLRAVPPTDPVLVLGITDNPLEKVDPDLLNNLFTFSSKNRLVIQRPNKEQREAFFANILDFVKKTPRDFPEPLNRKKRKLEVLQIAPPPEVKPPTKEEIRAQKKRDHQLLNLLKIQIQPIMDQIQKKYRKFRQAAISQDKIQYLLNEVDPNFVRPDIEQTLFRPFEIDTDKEGVKGLRETSSGKFFYNLETTTIEERLSNGFYARPKDFLHDIKTLARDSKHMGDKERALRANELVANVEVDMMGIEVLPAFQDCENVYQRQLQRTKDRADKEKKRAEENLFGVNVTSDIVGKTVDPQSGAVILGQPISGARNMLFSTPARGSSSLSNGILMGPNESSAPSRQSDDIQMGGTDENTQPTQHSHAMQPPSQLRSVMSANFPNPPLTSQLSQRSGFQELPHGVLPSDLINDASTTTSGKKTGTSDGWSTQATNGIPHGAQSSSPIEKSGQDSQLPDTQVGPSQQPSQQGASNPSSDEQWPHSQAHGLARGALAGFQSQNTPSSGSQYSPNPAVPPFNAPTRATSISKPSGFANILNDSPIDESASSQLSSQGNEYLYDPYFLSKLQSQLVNGTSGCSVEQLEQINRELMEELWKMRGEWNRNTVAAKLVNVFNETIRDIEAMQKVLQASQVTGYESEGLNYVDQGRGIMPS